MAIGTGENGTGGGSAPLGPDGGVVLVTWPSYDPTDPRTGARLDAAGLKLRLAPKLGTRTHDEVRDLARDAVAAIVSTDPFDAGVFAAAPRLRVVARVGVGVDSIDVAAATEAGVLVTTTPGDNEVTVADHTLALMLAAVRRVPEHDASVRRGEWDRAGGLTGAEMTGAVVGLVGFGRIAQRVARRLRGFDVTLLACDPAHDHQDGVELVELPELLARSEVVSLHVPLDADTEQMIGAAEIALMRPGAVLVNTARGGLVDEGALADALRSGALRAAALDVFADEPPASSPLTDLPNVVLSPHVAGLSHLSMARMLQTATSCVLDALGGEVPHGLVNHAALERRPRALEVPAP